MSFETEILSERFDVPAEKVWHVISLYWEATQYESLLSPFAFAGHAVTDIRQIQEWHGEYDGMELSIIFARESDRLNWLGVTTVGQSPLLDYEHVLGYTEVRHVLISSDKPVDVRIVCGWKPFYLFFKEMGDTLLSFFKQQPIDKAVRQILQFKDLVERQTFRDIYVSGCPKENIARGFLQSYLVARSYREVPVRGGVLVQRELDKSPNLIRDSRLPEAPDKSSIASSSRPGNAFS